MKSNIADIKILKEALEYLQESPDAQRNTWPDYDGRVISVLGLLEDFNYLSNYEKLDEEDIENMSLKQLATMYTFINRGERFCDGHIGAFIESGRMLRLVERHIYLLENTGKRRFFSSLKEKQNKKQDRERF